MDVLSDVQDTLSDLENLDINKHWTIYFLIDLRVVYIITYAYITIVNVISSTANSEATDDKQSMMNFNVSDKYTDVPVNGINDAILWNCREKSLSIFYYKSLYVMAIGALSAALVGFCLAKFLTICISSRKHALKMLWQIAGLQYLKDKMTEKSLSEKEILKKSKNEIPDEIYKELKKCSCNFNLCRILIPLSLLFLLIIIMASGYFAYDLHPLACLSLSTEDSIEYEETSHRVTIKVANQLLIYQIVPGLVAVVLLAVFLLLAFLFYYSTNEIINRMKKEYPKLLLSQSQEQSTPTPPAGEPVAPSDYE